MGMPAIPGLMWYNSKTMVVVGVMGTPRSTRFSLNCILFPSLMTVSSCRLLLVRTTALGPACSAWKPSYNEMPMR